MRSANADPCSLVGCAIKIEARYRGEEGNTKSILLKTPNVRSIHNNTYNFPPWAYCPSTSTAVVIDWSHSYHNSMKIDYL